MAKKRKPYYYIYKDVAGAWRFNFRGANNRVVCTSGEGYKTKRAVLAAVELLKSSSGCDIRYEGEADNKSN